MPRLNTIGRQLRLAALAGLSIVGLAACGDSTGGDAADAATRTIDIEMVDTAYEPTELAVDKGETVRFVFTNDGELDHEAFLGTASEQREHGEDMAGKNDGGGHHTGGEDDETSVTVEPSDRGELTTKFSAGGRYEIGCHEPGHYEAGMRLTVTVS
jgi:uncharacterized cupredoxin-like copper-binding protein